MAITASSVKQLREMTGAGMMDCKKALTETNGDVEAAVEFLRKKGLAAAAKKAGRVAAEGTVATLVEGNKGVVLEVNCETDFVSKGDDFQGFAKEVANFIVKNDVADIEALRDGEMGKAAVNLTAKCGEKVDLRRFVGVANSQYLASYNHGGKIGVLVDLNVSGEANDAVKELGKNLAMHVAASAPQFLDANDIDEDYKKKEAAVYAGQLREEGKPENMIDKIVMGKLNKLATEVCLLKQKYIMDQDFSVEKFIAKVAGEQGMEISVKSFQMLKLGEGIEKKEDNLADEVAKMTGQQ